jgi:hypothetical protein
MVDVTMVDSTESFGMEEIANEVDLMTTRIVEVRSQSILGRIKSRQLFHFSYHSLSSLFSFRAKSEHSFTILTDDALPSPDYSVLFCIFRI